MQSRAHAVKRVLAAAGLMAVALAACFAPAPAEARVFVRLGVGVPFYAPPPAYYYPPPAYYYGPPPAYYAPPPTAYYAPPQPSYAPPPAPAASTNLTCREYQSTTTIDGQPQPTYGRACLQPDGTWRIVE